MKPFLIGVTGPIGGGKSRLLNNLEERGFSVLKADNVAKELIYTEKNKHWLGTILGTTIFNTDESFDFAEIRKIIFSRQEALAVLNEYTSKHVWPEIKRRAEAFGELVVIIENALLFEDKWEDYFNLTVCVYCDEKESIRRVTETRNVSHDDVVKIIATQLPLHIKIESSDITIDTTHFKKHERYKSMDALLSILQARYPNLFAR